MLITLLLAFLPGFTEKIQTRVAGLKKKKKLGGRMIISGLAVRES